MALHTQNDSGHSEVDLFATLIFLGALCCTVLGIKLKWFKANLSLDNEEPSTSTSTVQVRNEVYRSIATELYTPSFKVIDETEYDKPKRVQIGKPVLQSTTRDLKPTIPSTANNQSLSKVGEDLSKTPSAQNSSLGQSKTSSETKTESTLNVDAKLQKTKEKEDLKRQKEEEKRIKKEKIEKAKAKARAKAREEKKKKEEKQKEDKQKKEEKQKEEKLKKEEKQKKDGQQKKEKKDNTSKPVASVTIDAEAVESTQRNLQNDVTFSKVKPKEVQQAPDNQTRNTRNKTQVNQAPVDTGFSSSWDMVAAHRQNLQREVKKPMNNNNLRSMSSQNNASTTPSNLSKERNEQNAETKINTSFSKEDSENSDTEA